MSGQIIGPIGVLPTVVAGLTLDPNGANPGSAFVSSGTTVAPVISTNSASIVVVALYANGVAGNPNTWTCVGSTLGSFALRGTSFGSSGNVTSFWKFASGALSSETITITLSGATSACAAVAFAVNGSPNTAAPFDTNGGLPVIALFTGNCVIPMTQTNDMAFCADTLNSSSSTASTGYTALYNSNFFMVEYKNGVSGSSTASDPPSGGGAVLGDALRGT